MVAGRLLAPTTVTPFPVRTVSPGTDPATFPLGQVQEAYRRLARGHILGKIVLLPWLASPTALIASRPRESTA